MILYMRKLKVTKEISKRIEDNFKLKEVITTKEKEIYEFLLQNINNGNEYFLKEKKNHKIQTGLKTLIVDKYHKERYDLVGGRFLPEHIKTNIENKITHILRYSTQIGSHKVLLEFGILDEDELTDIDKYEDYTEWIFTWLHFCFTHTGNSCVETLNIKIYLSSINKVLPGNKTKVLGPSEINTGYTYHCKENNEIVIFRSEEWMKVLLHETMHCFGFDMSSHDMLIKNTLKKYFPIKSEFLLSESYAEFWARTLNIVFYNYFLHKKRINSKRILEDIKYGLEIEKYYSIYQSSKILDYMSLGYDDIVCNSEKNICLRQNLYRERTNVFSYYILTSILFFDYESVLIFFKKSNKHLLKFHSNRENIVYFLKMIIKRSRNKKYRTQIYKSRNMLNKYDDSLRMSAF